ncbi:MAG TPA: kelch repeat-containing protein, partial [Candidatus Sulfotelmatobacter sp.]|nr:kelch repeat-containing protein [Candidatus Sulfotelmatobacter sp.]
MHDHRRSSISLVVIITTLVGIFAGISSLPPAHAVLPNPISWATKAPIPFATGQAAVVGGLDGRIYVIGGFSGGSPVSTASAYDPRTNTWNSIASEPTATRGSGVAVDNNGLIYVISGCCTTSNNQIYNATSNTWT